MYCISDQSQILKRQRIEWECDVCKVAKFPTYDEALEHEKNCLGSNNELQKISLFSPSVAKKERKCSDTILQENRKESETVSPTVTVSPTSESYSVTHLKPGKIKQSELFFPKETYDESAFNSPEFIDISESPLADTIIADKNTQQILSPDNSIKLDSSKEVLQPTRRSSRKKKPTKSIEFKSVRPPAPIFEKRAKKKDTQTRRTTTTSVSQAKKKKSDAPLASIFTKKPKAQSPPSKEVLAQHRAAEFMAKRKADAKKERMKNMKKKKQTIATIFQPTSKKDKNQENDNKTKKEKFNNQYSTKLAPFFPSPTHVIQVDPFNTCKEQSQKYSLVDDDSLYKSNCALLKYPRYPHEKLSILQKYNELSITLPHQSGTNSDIYDPLYQIFDQTFFIPSNYEKSAMLYAQKYSSPMSLEENPTAKHLIDFLRPYDRQQHSLTSYSQSSITSDWTSTCSFIDSDGEADEDANIFILTGPTSCGKTSMVYSCAESLDCFHILEINSSMKRGGSALKSAIEEATLSHRLMRKGKGSNDTRMSKALILIDEVENLFPDDGDAGFWASLYQLSKKSKSPIILTAESIPSAVTQVFSNYEHGEVSLPSVEQCAQTLVRVANDENICIKNRSNCEKIAEMMNCDLRKILLELQCWALTGGKEIKDNTPRLGNFRKSYDTCEHLYSPKILSVSPRVLSSSQHTPITIFGNFCHPKNTVLYVSLGLKPIDFQKISTSTIIAVIPPLTVPETVNRYGFYKDSELECTSLKYPLINVKIVQKDGIVLSDKEKVRLEYVFPSFDGLDLCNSRKESGQQNNVRNISEKKNLTLLLDGNAICDDGEFEYINDNEITTMQEKNRILTSEQLNSELKKQKTLSDIHPSISNCPARSILDKAIKEYYERADVKLEQNLSSVNAEIEMSDNTKECFKEELYDVQELDKYCNVMSEAMYFDDALNINRLPYLSGSVQGIGNHTTGNKMYQNVRVMEDQQKIQNKPPSFEKLFTTSTSTSSLYHGCSNTYLTSRMSTRERGLLSRKANSPSLDSVEMEVREEIHVDENLVNYEKSIPLSDLPKFLMESVNESNLHCPQTSYCTLNFKRWKMQHDSIPLAVQLTSDTGIERMNSVCFGTNFDDQTIELSPGTFDLNEYLDLRLVLDYLPTLRSIAYTENLSEQEYLSSNDQNRSRNADQNSTRRSSTRRTKNGRRHYFESFLCNLGSLSKEEKNGKKVGDALSRLYMERDCS